MKIKRLSDNIINLIAAGEVIERPASVVKELVENSIDAGASVIKIWLEESGKNLIVIEDNGSGMSKEDLMLAPERHATSKLDEKDITNINSFGFRGEALASISSISRLTIETCDNDGNKALRLSFKGDQIYIEEIYGKRGTKITIRDLFYATPVRLKFLKSDRVELAYCLEVIRKIAISYPNVSFECYHNDKSVLSFTTHNYLTDVDVLQARISEALSPEFIKNSIKISQDFEDLKISGYVGLPTFHKSSNSDQYLFVNNRPIKDKVLYSALKIAYQDFLMAGRHPCIVILLEMSPHLIDVNVHPCKTEIRFRDDASVRSAIVTILKKAIHQAGHKSSDLSLNLQNYARPYEAPANYAQSKAPEHFNAYTNYPKFQTQDLPPLSNFADRAKTHYQPNQYLNSPPQSYNSQHSDIREENNYPLGAACAQMHNTYIISQTKDSVIIIDQHAAHERIVYEELKDQMSNVQIMKQALLVPIVIKITDNMHKATLQNNMEAIAKVGFRIDFINDNSVALFEVPKLLADSNLEQIFNDIIHDIAEMGETFTSDNIIEKITETYACHHSIRAGKKLSILEMDALLRKMENTPHSGQCNHGRPTYVELKLTDIEKLFGRK